MRYAIVIKNAGSNFSGLAPNFPGCVPTDAKVEETEQERSAVIRFHMEGS